METAREGRTVRHAGHLYQFRTVEQALGFYHGLQQGKSVDLCRQRWRPAQVRVAAGVSSTPDPGPTRSALAGAPE